MVWNAEQNLNPWFGMPPEEEPDLTDEELQMQLEQFFQQMGGPPPSLRRADSNPLMPQDVNAGMEFLQATPNRQKIDRSKGEANALQQLSKQTGPRPPAPGNYGQAVAEREWGSGSPQQLPFDSIPSVEETRFNPPSQMPPAGEQPPFDAAIPPDDLYNRLNQAPGTTEPPPSIRRTSGDDQRRVQNMSTSAYHYDHQGGVGDRWQPSNPNARGNQAGGPVRTVTVDENGQVSELPPRELTDAERGPAVTFAGEPQYQDTMYAGMTPEQRQLMQVQPDDKFGPMLRTAEELGIPVEMQYSETGEPRPVIDARYTEALTNADPAQQNLFRGAVFSDEMVDGVPTFDNQSIRRRINTGRIANPEVENRRIERNMQEEFDRRPEVRAARLQQGIDQQQAAYESELDFNRTVREARAKAQIDLETEAYRRELEEGREGRSRSRWRHYVEKDENGNVTKTDLIGLMADPEAAKGLADTLSGQLQQRFRTSNLIGEEQWQFPDEESIAEYTSRLLETSARDQANGLLPQNASPQDMADIILLATSLGARTKGGILGFGDHRGGYVPDSMGQALNVITDVAMGSGNTRGSGPNKFNLDDLTGEERNAWTRITAVVDNAAIGTPGTPQNRRYIDSRIREYEDQIEDIDRKLNPPPHRTHMRGEPVEYPRTVPPQEKADLLDEMEKLKIERDKFREAAASASLRHKG